MDETTTPLEAAIKAAGTQQALAAALGIRSASISGWKALGRVPAERVLDVEEATGVSRYDLRPDIFGTPPAQGAAPDANRIVPVEGA